jgi:hypothetical protein
VSWPAALAIARMCGSSYRTTSGSVMSGYVVRADPDQLNGVWDGTCGPVAAGSADHRFSRGVDAAPVASG